MKVVIFDFDGTIADTFDAVLRITNRLAVEFGYQPAAPEEIKRLQNLSSREIIKQSQIPLFKLPFLIRRLRSELREEIQQIKLIPGIKEALIALKHQENQLGIVTSNSTENVTAFLETHRLKELFNFVHSGTTLFGKGRIINQILQQNNLTSDRAIYVGDETRDIEAARKINIKVIAVSWGFNSSQALAEQNPDFLIHKPAELIEAIASL